MSVKRYLEETTPAERQRWRKHFEKYSYGDFYCQVLLARLCTLVASALSKEAVSPRDFAPWINWQQDRSGEEVAADTIMRDGLAALVASQEDEDNEQEN